MSRAQVNDVGIVLGDQAMERIEASSSPQTIRPVLGDDRDLRRQHMPGALENLGLVTLRVHPNEADSLEIDGAVINECVEPENTDVDRVAEGLGTRDWGLVNPDA